MSAPGTLSAEDQLRLMQQLMGLIRAAYGEEIHFAVTIMRRVQTDAADGVAIYTMGTVAEPKILKAMLEAAANNLADAEYRKLVMHDAEGRAQ